MRPEQYPPFGFIHLKQDGTEFPPLEPNTRFYFNQFADIMEWIKNSSNYDVFSQALVKIELRRVEDYYQVTLRYTRSHVDAYKITGPIPSSPYLEYVVQD